MKKTLAVSLIALICACTEQNGGQTGPKSADLTWDSVALHIEEPIVSGEDLSYLIDIRLDTLVGESELAKQFAAVLRDSVLSIQKPVALQEAMATFAKNMETEWKTELAELYDNEDVYKEMLEYNYTLEGNPVENGNDSVLSYQTTTDCYLGGAHGSYVVKYYNFDMTSGKLLNISDVVPAAKEMLMLMAMEEQLCKDWDAEDLADLQEQTGITMLGDLYLTNNFLLKKDSIEFLFNQYEIAPYAAGLISVTLPRP